MSFVRPEPPRARPGLELCLQLAARVGGESEGARDLSIAEARIEDPVRHALDGLCDHLGRDLREEAALDFARHAPRILLDRLARGDQRLHDLYGKVALRAFDRSLRD